MERPGKKKKGSKLVILVNKETGEVGREKTEQKRVPTGKAVPGRIRESPPRGKKGEKIKPGVHPGGKASKLKTSRGRRKRSQQFKPPEKKDTPGGTGQPGEQKKKNQKWSERVLEWSRGLDDGERQKKGQIRVGKTSLGRKGNRKNLQEHAANQMMQLPPGMVRWGEKEEEKVQGKKSTDNRKKKNRAIWGRAGNEGTFLKKCKNGRRTLSHHHHNNTRRMRGGGAD